MFYENTQTGEFGLTLYQVRRAIPNASIPEGTAEVGPFKGYVARSQPQIEWNQNVVEAKPAYGVQQWEVVPASAQEQKDRLEAKSQQVRAERDPLLSACDWTQLLDAPCSDAKVLEWRQYRQALRDITSQPGFPWTVQWPMAPSEE